jgi:hypothetical protein
MGRDRLLFFFFLFKWQKMVIEFNLFIGLQITFGQTKN